MSHQHWTTLLKYSLSPNQEYLLDCYREKIVPSKDLIDEFAERQALIHKGYLSAEGKLTPTALMILDECETFKVKTKKKVTTDVLGQDFLDKIHTYRETFPAIRLSSGLTARQSVKELQDKFVWFFKTYPDFTWDLVLDAATVYNLESERNGHQFMQTSSYFIQKTDNKSKVSKSSLADYCQLILDNPAILNQYQ